MVSWLDAYDVSEDAAKAALERVEDRIAEGLGEESRSLPLPRIYSGRGVLQG